jgi:hypothetical protein
MAHLRSRDTTAPPDRVWSIWSDTSTWPEWNPDVLSVSIKGPFATGTTGEMRTKAGGAHQIRLDNVQPGQAFELKTSVMPLSALTFRCEVAPSGAGSRISQEVMLTGPLGFVFSPMMGPRIAESFGPLLDGLARKAESS